MVVGKNILERGNSKYKGPEIREAQSIRKMKGQSNWRVEMILDEADNTGTKI
jgi:hypothetical protein